MNSLASAWSSRRGSSPCSRLDLVEPFVEVPCCGGAVEDLLRLASTRKEDGSKSTVTSWGGTREADSIGGQPIVREEGGGPIAAWVPTRQKWGARLLTRMDRRVASLRPRGRLEVAITPSATLESAITMHALRRCSTFSAFLFTTAIAVTGRADFAYCSYNFGPGTAGGPPQATACASTSTGAGFSGGAHSGFLPDGYAQNVAKASEIATGDGAVASAVASASVGELNATLSAKALTVPDPVDDHWGAIASAQSAFYDNVTIEGLPGVPLGAPVNVHVIAVVDNSFPPEADAASPGPGADFDGSVYVGSTLANVPLKRFYDASNPGSGSDTELPLVHTGDTLRVYWTVSAHAAIDAFKLPRSTSAILHATFFIDVTSGNARAIGTTGHDYASGAGTGAMDAGTSDASGDAAPGDASAAGGGSGAGAGSPGGSGSGSCAMGGPGEEGGAIRLEVAGAVFLASVLAAATRRRRRRRLC